MNVSLVTRASVRGTLSDARDGGDVTFDLNEGSATSVDNGTGAGQANAVFIDEFSIAASGTLSIDLSGSLEDPLGDAVVFTAVKEILVIADAANANNVVVGGAASNTFVGPFADATDKVNVKPGGLFHAHDGYSAAGWAVAAGTGDILQLANSGAGSAVTGTIVIIGEQA